jgi:hypothetical protein
MSRLSVCGCLFVATSFGKEVVYASPSLSFVCCGFNVLLRPTAEAAVCNAGILENCVLMTCARGYTGHVTVDGWIRVELRLSATLVKEFGLP